MTANERRRLILQTLCRRRHETRENLAFEFGVSKRTIEYDILTLSLEYPVFTTQGNGGGIYVMEGFYLDKSYFTDKQYDLLKRLFYTLIGEDAVIMKTILRDFGMPTGGIKK